MSSLKIKWEKGKRVWGLKRQAHACIAAARLSGKTDAAILVTNLAQMGDVVLSAGVVAALRERHPDAPLLFAGQPRWLEILEDDPAVDGLLGAQTLYEIRALAQTKLFRTVYVLDIPIPDLLHYLDGLENIFRYEMPTTRDWFTHGQHLMTLYEQNAGLQEGQARSRVWLRPIDQEKASAFLAPIAPVQGPLIALHTQSSGATKNWPQNHFAALITRWNSKHQAHFVLLGGPGEAAALASLPGVTHLAGQLTVKQTAAVIARCDLFVGLDSGLAYAAEAVGTPGLVILGATTEETSGPRDHALFSSVRPAEACLPACHRACTRVPYCITELRVDEVDHALEAVWARHLAREAPCPSR